MCKAHTERAWTAEAVVTGVAAFLQNTNRRHLKKELARALDCSLSYSDKLINGQMASISAHMLLTLDAWSGGELIRSLRGLPEDEASRELFKHLDAIRRIASEHL